MNDNKKSGIIREGYKPDASKHYGYQPKPEKGYVPSKPENSSPKPPTGGTGVPAK